MPVSVPDVEDLIEDLLFLRKGAGVTPGRLRQASVADEVLRHRVHDGFERLKNRLVSAIGSLEPAETELLLDVFGLSHEAAGMTRLLDRRRLHAAKISRGVDTVADREIPALQHLLSTLVTGRYAQSPLVIDVPEMHDGIIYETTSTLIVVKDRKWLETREHYRFAATFDEMDYLTVTRSYPAKASAVTGGAFRLNTRETSHGFNDHFWHRNVAGDDAPMMRGETYDLKFRLEPEDFDAQTPIRNAYRAFHERSLLASIQVAFIGERPATIWKYERVSHFAQPGHPNDYNHISIDGRGVATVRLRDLHGGLASGIAWIWDGELGDAQQ